MQIHSKREKTFVIIGGVLVLAILFWNFASPAGSKTSKTTLLPLAEARHQHDLAHRNIARMLAEQDSFKKSVKHKAWKGKLTVDELVPIVVRELQRKAGQSGIHLREIRPLRPRMIAGGAGVGVPLELRFRAPFQPSIVRFLYHAEDVGEPDGRMVVDKLDVTSSDPHAREVDVAAQVTVFTLSPSVGEGGDNSNVTDKTNKI